MHSAQFEFYFVWFTFISLSIIVNADYSMFKCQISYWLSHTYFTIFVHNLYHDLDLGSHCLLLLLLLLPRMPERAEADRIMWMLNWNGIKCEIKSIRRITRKQNENNKFIILIFFTRLFSCKSPFDTNWLCFSSSCSLQKRITTWVDNLHPSTFGLLISFVSCFSHANEIKMNDLRVPRALTSWHDLTNDEYYDLIIVRLSHIVHTKYSAQQRGYDRLHLTRLNYH